MTILPTPVGFLNGYFGQYTPPSADILASYCDGNVQTVTLAFMNKSPNNAPAWVPGDNFAGYCGSEVFTFPNGTETEIYTHCPAISDSIRYCQRKGVKVLLSVGGADISSSDYGMSTVDEGKYFAEYLWKMVGPKDASFNGPRPFDTSKYTNVLDGFDFDIEMDVPSEPYIAMIDALRSYEESMTITAAPQCPIQNNVMLEIIKKAKFDALNVQFYNNEACEPFSSGSGDKFNYDDWVATLHSSEKSKEAKLYIGLPASEDSATSGYISVHDVKKLVCEFSTHKNFGGVTLWDLEHGRLNTNAATCVSYNRAVHEILKYGCGAKLDVNRCPASTSSTSTSSTRTSSTSTSSTSTSSTRTSSTRTSSTSTNSTRISVTAGSTAGTSSTLATTTGMPFPNGTTTLKTGTQRTKSRTGKTGPHHRPTKSVNPSSTYLTTSTYLRTTTHTITSCPPTVTNCPVGKVTTETIIDYTTYCPVTATEKPKPTTTPSMTLSTVYSTHVHTITSCPPTVTNCPVGKVTTETVIDYTTYCPVAATETGPGIATTAAPENTPAPEGSSGESPAGPASTTTTSATSTIYRTVVVPAPSGSIIGQPAPAQPSQVCSGPGCPGASAPAPAVTSVPVPASSVPGVPCSTGLPIAPTTTGTLTQPVRGGASGLTVGLGSLMAMVIVQALAL